MSNHQGGEESFHGLSNIRAVYSRTSSSIIDTVTAVFLRLSTNDSHGQRHYALGCPSVRPILV